MGVSAGVAALVVFGLARASRPIDDGKLNFACTLAIAGGVVLGCGTVGLWPRWPPMNGLDRLLTIVLSAAIVIELIGSMARVPRRLAWALRVGLVIVTGRVLLRGSTYLVGPNAAWTTGEATAALALCAAIFGGVWLLLAKLSQRSPGISIPLAVGLAILGAGMAIMLAGYVKGGIAGMLLAAALVGSVLSAGRLAPRCHLTCAIGLGVVSLAGLLFIGRFFGGLTTANALTMFLCPLLCWTTELPLLRSCGPRIIGALRIAVVAIPLVVIFVRVLRDFKQHTIPLL